MENKERYRKQDKEKWNKRNKKKAKQKEKRQKHQVSRDKRKLISKEVGHIPMNFRRGHDQHVLFVINETDNMEQILLEVHNIEDKDMYFLSLPILNQEVIDEALGSYVPVPNEEIKDFVINDDNYFLHYVFEKVFGVSVGEIFSIDDKIIVAKCCKIIDKRHNVIEAIVNPYDFRKWYYGNDATTMMGLNVYRGKKLQQIFYTKVDLSNVYIHQDTLIEIVLYRMMTGKVDAKESFRETRAFKGRSNLIRCWFYGGTEYFEKYKGPIEMALFNPKYLERLEHLEDEKKLELKDYDFHTHHL